MRIYPERTLQEAFDMLRGFCKVIGEDPIEKYQWGNITEVFTKRLSKEEECSKEVLQFVVMLRGYIVLNSRYTPTRAQWAIIRKMALDIPFVKIYT